VAQQSKCPKCGVERLDRPQNEIELAGKKIQLFLGYADKSVLKALNFHDKVAFLEKRAKLVFLDSLEEIFYLVGENALAKFHFLNATTIICCAIEGLGHYWTGSDESGRSFKEFIKEFMDPEFQKTLTVDGKQCTYSEILWEDFRNGLAHGFYIKRGGIERGEFFFKFDDKIGLQINIDRLFLEFKKAFGDFFDRLQLSDERSALGQNFIKRFEDFLEKYDVNYQVP
jgi:predicted nucleic-acid-binding Zn-ribbon protein